jgi:signal transduction histidine kinase
MIEIEKEYDRLKALQRYQILDTPTEGSFDRITLLASQLLNVPVAITSLVDTDRVWFKSRHGVELEEVRREPGLCASAILHNKPYILNDASTDPQSLAHPLVARENGFRFYAGVPLNTHDNHNLGTLCVIDYKPRIITDEEINILNVLAQITMDEMELRLASRNIDKLTRQKSALLAVLSHEIRTPMNGILGMASLLQSTDLTEEQKEYLDTIDSCGATLLTLLNHILDFSKFEAGEMAVNPELFEIHSCVKQVLDLFSAQAIKKGIVIKSELASEISHVLVGDKHKIRQVLMNLIGNAVKFTKKGEIQILVDLISADSQHQRLSFRVVDTGIGIPHDYRDQLFQPYSQVHSKIADEHYGGTGLGLSICKQLVELMHGRIWLENSTNHGSTFTFEIGFPLKT